MRSSVLPTPRTADSRYHPRPSSPPARTIAIFFDCLDAVQRVTRALDAHPDRFCCRRCGQSTQFVSHGFVYRKQYRGDRAAVGKRLFCANRRGRSGCGATLRLYLADGLPRLHRDARVVQTFVLALLAGTGTAAAYLQATGAQSSRHGWRWLTRLGSALGHWRARLSGPAAQDAVPFAQRVRRLRLLLPTLAALRQRLGDAFVARFQIEQQAVFLP